MSELNPAPSLSSPPREPRVHDVDNGRMTKPRYSMVARLLRHTLVPVIAGTLSFDNPMARQRQTLDLVSGAALGPVGVRGRRAEAAGRPIRVWTPPNPRAGVLLYLHGGGYVTGSLKSHAALAARMAQATRRTCVQASYRLAPEHPFPAGLDDAVAVTTWAARQHAGPLILAGDSAGGGLALATACALRDAGAPAAGHILFSPWVDLTLSGESFLSRADDDLILDPVQVGRAVAAYRGLTPADDPRVSPLLADLSGLGPSLIQVGEREILRDDALRLHAKLKEAGGASTLQIDADMWHVWQAFAPLMRESRAALRAVSTWTRDTFDAN